MRDRVAIGYSGGMATATKPQLDIGPHGYDERVLDAAASEAGVGGSGRSPRVKCPTCGGISTNRVGVRKTTPIEIRVKALLIAGWDGRSGCPGEFPDMVAEAARLLDRGFLSRA